MTTMPPPDAYTVFQRARSAVSSATYPRRIDYTVAISGFDGDRFRENHYRASYLRDGTILEDPISDEELAAPPTVPHGFTIRIQGIVIGRQPASPDLIGVPLLAPTYAFGLRFPQTSGTSEPDSSGAPIPTIAIVSTASRAYAVTLLDEPLLDGRLTYHLQLTPLRKPSVNRLRELWVDANDDLPRKAVVAGNFTTAPLTGVPWTISFGLFDGVPVIEREVAGAIIHAPHHRVLRDVSVAFESVREPDGSPIGEPMVAPQIDDEALLEPPA